MYAPSFAVFLLSKCCDVISTVHTYMRASSVAPISTMQGV